MLLALHKVAKFFGPRCIFKGVSLTVLPATVSLLVGANGAGKSTLLRIMAGLSRPSAGEVQWEVGPEAVGYLGHATFLYPALTARENLLFWSEVHGLKLEPDALDAVLERVELAPFALERAGVFSRGMAQRLNLARVLLLAPKLWLLDEPGTGLDLRSAAMLRREVAHAREQGAAVVWISHDLATDGPLADRVLALDGGLLCHDGSWADYMLKDQGTGMGESSRCVSC